MTIDQKIHFSVSGDSLTKISRDMFLSGDWEQAVSILYDGLDGLSYEDVFGILKGDLKLFGNYNEIELIDEDDFVKDKYKKEYFDIYNIVYKDKNGYVWKPYAYVNSLYIDDYIFALKTYGKDYKSTNIALRPEYTYHDNVLTSKFHKLRSMFYANNYLNDLCEVLYCSQSNSYEFVLFERMPESPFWLNVIYKNIQDYLNVYLKFNRIKERGYQAIYFEERNNKLRQMFFDNDIIINYDKIIDDKQKLKLDVGFKKPLLNIDLNILENIRRNVINQANSQGDKGWLYVDVALDENSHENIKIPYAPFVLWALRSVSQNIKHLLPKWETVSPSGLKVDHDDPNHSDWLIGYDIQKFLEYDIIEMNAFNDAITDMTCQIQEEFMNYNCAVLNGNGNIRSGVVVHPKPDQEVKNGSIIVIPNAGVEYYIPMITSCRGGVGAVITEIGGSGCHLVVNGREKDIPIVLVKNAREIFLPGIDVMVDAEYGIVRIKR